MRVLLLAALTAFGPVPAESQAALTMTYRGSLGARVGQTSEPPVLSFRVYDAPAGGTLVAGPYASGVVTTADGTVETSFGPVPVSALAPGRRWLEVSSDGAPVERVEIETVYYDGLDEHGALTGGVHFAPLARAGPALLGGPVTAMLVGGAPSNRIDLVFVGDGYLASEFASFAAHAQSGLDQLMAIEPFATYRSFFNAYRVDVASPESGVDHDPTFGVLKNTAMDMGFWCSGLERLLCAHVTKAYGFAAAAPAVDHVLAVANSTKYGGAGYSASDLATYSGGNASAAEVAIHEIGHSLGNLADEYDYGDGATYTGGETGTRNTSILTSSAMATAGTKWTAWLGDPSVGFGGPVGTYEGATHYQYGVYRPTHDSKMRSLGRPFNMPSVEGLVIEFYRLVSPIDDAAPTSAPLSWGSVAWVDPVDPVGSPLTIQWFLDGAPIEGATADTLRVDSIGVAPGLHTLSVRVRDETPFVRDQAARDAWMTATRSWGLTVPSPAAVGPSESAALSLSVSPAPFAAASKVRYRLARPGRVRLAAYDLAGRMIVTLRDAVEPAGEHEVAFDARDVPPGLIVFRLETDAGAVTRKALRVR